MKKISILGVTILAISSVHAQSAIASDSLSSVANVALIDESVEPDSAGIPLEVVPDDYPSTNPPTIQPSRPPWNKKRDSWTPPFPWKLKPDPNKPNKPAYPLTPVDDKGEPIFPYYNPGDGTDPIRYMPDGINPPMLIPYVPKSPKTELMKGLDKIGLDETVVH
jgi:hypothetical protein